MNAISHQHLVSTEKNLMHSLITSRVRVRGKVMFSVCPPGERVGTTVSGPRSFARGRGGVTQVLLAGGGGGVGVL